MNKVIRNNGNYYITIGAKRIIERLFGKTEKKNDFGFDVIGEDHTEKTIVVKLSTWEKKKK